MAVLEITVNRHLLFSGKIESGVFNLQARIEKT